MASLGENDSHAPFPSNSKFPNSTVQNDNLPESPLTPGEGGGTDTGQKTIEDADGDEGTHAPDSSENSERAQFEEEKDSIEGDKLLSLGLPMYVPLSSSSNKEQNELSYFHGGDLMKDDKEDIGLFTDIMSSTLGFAESGDFTHEWAGPYPFFSYEMIPLHMQGYNGPAFFTGANYAHSSIDSTSAAQITQQFHKTKMCAFYMKGKCTRGAECAYAHSSKELQQNPDLKKTRLCDNFFQQKCFDPNCSFAHGYDELRSTEGVYKTVFCRFLLTTGYCKTGSACRFAHTPEELRPVAP